MERFNRAARRYHLARMKARARAIFHWSPRAHHFANHLAVCSGPCCGNPRHWGEGPAVAERRATQPDESMRPVRGSKRRARWCRGRHGVEHQLRWRQCKEWQRAGFGDFYDLVCVVCGRVFAERQYASDGDATIQGRLLKRRRWSLRGKARQVPPLPTE